jgi:uncharacterized protein (TIGR00369 family)
VTAMEWPTGGIGAVPFHDHLGLEISNEDGLGVVVMPLGDHVRGLVAPLHGGAIASLADVACGAALSGTYDPTATVPMSTDLDVRFLRQPRSGPVRAEARVVHRGRQIMATECVVTDGEGRELARATASYVLSASFGTLAEGIARHS